MAAFRSSRWANGETGSGSGKSLGRTPRTNTMTTIARTQVMAIITRRFSPLVYPLIQVLGVLLDLLLVFGEFGIFRLDSAKVGHRLRLVLADEQQDHPKAEANAGVGNDPTEGVGRRQVDRHAVVADERLHDLVVAPAHTLHLRDALLGGLGEVAFQHTAGGHRILAAAALALQTRAYAAHIDTDRKSTRLNSS